MFLTCGMVPAAATMDYNGDFQAGYQEIDGISLGYLQINGTRMFALTQVFSDLFKDIPRATVSKKMESLKIQSRRCDLKELRTLKAIHSVPMRAVKCSLISKADLEALRSSCQASVLRKRKRRKKSKRREPGDFFSRPRLLPQFSAASAKVGAGCAPPQARLGEPFARAYGKATQPPKSYGRSGRGQLLAGVLSAYPDDLQLLHSAVRAHRAGQTPGQPDARRPKRSACGCLAKEKGRSAPFAGSKRQGTSAGYSSDSESSGASSLGSSSDSSEEEEEEDDDDDDSSCSSEDSTSSGSESSSLCSGDSVQSTRYRQAALPRLPPPAASSQALPGVPKVLRPDPNLLFWARTLRASTLESCKPAPSGTPREHPQGEPEPGPQPEAKSTLGSPAPASSAREGPQPKNGGLREASEACVRPRDQVTKDAACPSAAEELQLGGEPAEASALQKDSKEGSGREAHFDRLIRQSKLWCYAKGFNVDGKGLRRAEQAKGSACASKSGLLGLAGKPLKGGGELERSAKRRRADQERQAKGRPPKLPRKTTKKGAGPPCKRLLHAGSPPARPPFTLMGTFPCTPALVVGSDGDLCPASSLCVKDSPGALAKTHPLWTWQLGSSAIPVPPSLKFRGCSLEDL